MINDKGYAARHDETLSPGQQVAFCRCWRSEKFPYCDGAHRRLNEAGDQVGPVIVTVEKE